MRFESIPLALCKHTRLIKCNNDKFSEHCAFLFIVVSFFFFFFYLVRLEVEIFTIHGV